MFRDFRILEPLTLLNSVTSSILRRHLIADAITALALPIRVSSFCLTLRHLRMQRQDT